MTGDDLGEFREALASGAVDLGLDISDAMLDAYSAHFTLLLARRPAAGLTSLTDPSSIAIKHFLDSLSCLLLRDIGPGERVADIGSGGGFPGLVLAVARPGAAYTLIESNQKRAYFLEEAINALHLENATVLRERAERVGRDPAHRERCDLVLTRAVAPLPVSLEYALPLARIGGHCLAMRGPQAQEDTERSGRALSELRGRIASTEDLSLPRSMGKRMLLLIEKVGVTPDRYPRRPGIPAKRPL
jgi:16S rRNA (guanine527-N7)-methyltransferase